MHNQVIGKERASDRIQKISKVQGSSARKAVYGVLTEPLEGDLQGKSDKVEAAERSYVPRAHVQFLEQAGIRVVPISYLDSVESILTQLEQVNGLYCPGDSERLLEDKLYQQSFKTILEY